jgi:hypothetical protein
MSGIDIFKLLPNTNCKECGDSSCLAFAMNLATGKTEIARCSYLSQDVVNEITSTIKNIPVIATTTCIGKKVDVKKIEKSDWDKESDRINPQYSIWFTSSEKPEHCQINKFQVYVTLLLDDNVISKITFQVHSIDTMGKGRTIEPLRLSPDDDNHAAKLIKEVLIES